MTITLAHNGPNVTLNDGPYGTFEHSAHTVLSDGRIVAVWSERSAGTESADIRAVLLDAKGQRIGDVFHVNTETETVQRNPAVHALANGGFVIAWESFGQDDFTLEGPPGLPFEQQYGLFQQIYDAMGAPVGGETLINDGVTRGSQLNIEFDDLPGGGYVVSWVHSNFLGTELPGDVDGLLHFSRVYDANGTAQGAPWQNPGFVDDDVSIGDHQLFPEYFTDAVALTGGNLAFVWNSILSDEFVFTLTDTNGTLIRQTDLVAGLGLEPPTFFATLALQDGGVLVAWENRVGGISEIFVVVADSQGNRTMAFQMPDTVDPMSIGLSGIVEIDANLLVDGSVLISWLDTVQDQYFGRVVLPDGTILSDLLEITPPGPFLDEFQISVSDSGQVVLTLEPDNFESAVTDGPLFLRTLTLDLDAAITAGTAGPDSITTGAGNDSVAAQAGNDTVATNDGDDFVQGEAGNDLLDGGTGDDDLRGGQGDDTLIGGAGFDHLNGEDGNDLLQGGDDADILNGGGGNDRLEGGAGNDTLYTVFGNDTLVGGLGDDYLGAGTFEYVFNSDARPRNLLQGGEGNDTLEAIDGDTLIGGEGNDLLVNPRVSNPGPTGDVFGGSGDDTVISGLAEGVLDGGTGYDILLIDPTSGVRVTLDLQSGQFTHFGDTFGSVSGFEEVNLSVVIQHAKVFGTQGADVISFYSAEFVVPGGSLPTGFRIETRGGDDLIIDEFAGSTFDFPGDVTIDAGDGNDTIFAGASSNIIVGGAGNDLILDGAHRDSIDAGSGNDEVRASDGRDTISLGLGNDLLTGGDGPDQWIISGNIGNDTITDASVEDQFVLPSDVIATSVFTRQGTNTLVTFATGSILFEALLINNWDVFNAAPGPVTLDVTSIKANLPSSTLIGTLSATDPEGQALTFSVEPGADVPSFEIIGDELFTFSRISELEDTTYDIPFLVEDAFGATTRTVISIDVFTAFQYDGTPGPDRIDGSPGSDTFFVFDGDDTVSAGAGDDTVEAGNGRDTVVGGDGNDSILGGTDSADLRDDIYAGDGNDWVDAGYGNDLVYGQHGNDTLLGGFGSDELIGQAGDDVINGGALSDLVFGNDGFDFINGGFGHDRVNGGADADQFFHLGIFDHGSDWIQDFSDVQGDALVTNRPGARVDDFQVNFTGTANAGVAGVEEAFVIYKPTGQILWALVDGGALSSIELQIGFAGPSYDLLTV